MGAPVFVGSPKTRISVVMFAGWQVDTRGSCHKSSLVGSASRTKSPYCKSGITITEEVLIGLINLFDDPTHHHNTEVAVEATPVPMLDLSVNCTGI